MTREPVTGLSAAEAETRLRTYGPNTLGMVRSRGLLAIILGTMREPMFIFLLAAATLYLIVGDVGEGVFLLGGALVSIVLVVFQDARSERWPLCVSWPNRLRTSSATVCRSERRRATWCRATSCSCQKGSVFRPTPYFAKATCSRSMNPC